jgi:hypothetical protein
MDIIFTHSRDRRDQTVVMRQDGVRLRVPVYGKLDPAPHDLAHYVIERELGLRDGFWGSVADGAVFAGMAILDGRQRPHARERSREVQRANARGILFAEVAVEALMRAVSGERLSDEALPVEHAGVRTRSDRDAMLLQLRPAMAEMCACWREVPMGDTLLVSWPDQPVRRTHRHSPDGRHAAGVLARSAGASHPSPHPSHASRTVAVRRSPPAVAHVHVYACVWRCGYVGGAGDRT